MDFAKGQKTITGLAVMLLPVIANVLGYNISEDTVVDLVAQTTTIVGASIALYGLVMKLIRFVKTIFKK